MTTQFRISRPGIWVLRSHNGRLIAKGSYEWVMERAKQMDEGWWVSEYKFKDEPPHTHRYKKATATEFIFAVVLALVVLFLAHSLKG